MFIAITRVMDRDGDPTNEIAKVWIETNRESVARNLQADVPVEYYVIKLAAQDASLKPALIKTGTRQAAPAREIIEVEADGEIVASIENEV